MPASGSLPEPRPRGRKARPVDRIRGTSYFGFGIPSSPPSPRLILRVLVCCLGALLRSLVGGARRLARHTSSLDALANRICAGADAEQSEDFWGYRGELSRFGNKQEEA